MQLKTTSTGASRVLLFGGSQAGGMV